MPRTRLVKEVLKHKQDKFTNVSISLLNYGRRALTLTEMAELKREGINWEPYGILGYIKFTWGKED